MKENQEYQNHLFRLAAVLYADNNYDVKIGTIHKKIIESVLLECGEKECSVSQIIDFCQNNYNIIFDENSILDVINNQKGENFHVNQKKDNTLVCLSEKRKLTLIAKIDNKTIDYFISEFIKIYKELTQNTDAKTIIYKFLYEVFSTNTESFQKLIKNNKIVNTINLESINYTEKEKEIINTFLFWDNSDKNKIIFDIASYALEYCMLTNEKSTSAIRLDNLKNKMFYLDTNIIYRALGINGKDRKNRTITFLKKFSESNEKLIISKSTDIEFKGSIKSQIDRIRKYNSPKINPKLFLNQEITIQRDIYNFYHEWRIGRTNTSLDLFEKHVLHFYNSFISEHKITVDYKIYYDVNKKQIQQTIKEYSSSIFSFKSKDRLEVLGSTNVDAENIFLIEIMRKGKVANLFETRFFLISTDQGLRRWDYQRLNQTPIVLLPSQWMSILLRYVSRTEDDYKSFVSFLNLRNNEVIIDNEKLQIVIAGISEMTTDIETQQNLLNNLIEHKFKDVISENSTYEQIFENAKKYTESKLELQIEELSKEHNELLKSNNILIKQQIAQSYQLDKTKQDIEKKFQSVNEEKIDISNKLSASEQKNESLREILRNKYIEEEMKKWERPAYVVLVFAILGLFFFLLQIFFLDEEWNFVQKTVDYIDSNPSETKRNLYVNIFGALCNLFITMVLSCYLRLFSKDKKEEKKKSIKEDIPLEYR